MRAADLAEYLGCSLRDARAYLAAWAASQALPSIPRVVTDRGVVGRPGYVAERESVRAWLFQAAA